MLLMFILDASPFAGDSRRQCQLPLLSPVTSGLICRMQTSWAWRWQPPVPYAVSVLYVINSAWIAAIPNPRNYFKRWYTCFKPCVINKEFRNYDTWQDPCQGSSYRRRTDNSMWRRMIAHIFAHVLRSTDVVPKRVGLGIRWCQVCADSARESGYPIYAQFDLNIIQYHIHL